MKLTFLGTGGVQSAPLFGCDCYACERARLEPRFARGATSALIDTGSERILLDAGRHDLHQRFRPGELSRILLTHFHMDHVAGLFSLRWGLGEPIPVWAPPDEKGCDDLFKHPGLLDFRSALTPFVPHSFGALQVTPLPLQHSKLTYGYLFDWHGTRLAWLCDTCGLPPDTADFLDGQPLDQLVIDCNDPPRESVRNHNDVTRALQIIEQLAPRQAWLIHLSHEMDSWLLNNRLPDNVLAAMDGQSITVGSSHAVTV
jgi:phosphoribosyl 1,2-cyclic phosphate phosphodiesterase